jgi:hypothetical protein
MNRDDIIKLAREAGFVVDEKAQQHQPNCIFHTHHMVDELLVRFAVLVSAEVLLSTKKDFLESYEIAYMDGAEAEREECAKACEHKMPQPVVNWSDAQIVEALRECAAAIRARGSQ